MATTGMASAASSFVLTSNISTVKISARANRRLVVRAEGGEQPPDPAAEGEEAKVAAASDRNKGKNHYEGILLAQQHRIMSCDCRSGSNTRYPVVVRFNKVNYAGASTDNYALDEIK